MSRRIPERAMLCTLVLFAAWAQATAQEPAAFDLRGGAPLLGVNERRLPESCLADFSSALAGPAGNQGFLFSGTDGRLYFESGRRARFWGVNVAKEAVFQSHEVIDATVDRIARAGFNLVRFHHLDGPEGLLPTERVGQRPRISPERRDSLDYWIAALKRRGIYVYLDLLSYRVFSAAEGVSEGETLGRGAKPMAVFDEKLIALQLQYARELLVEGVNPYTGLSYCNDPAVCIIELCDENGLFITQGKWRQMPPSYRQELGRKWNWWLKERFAATASLRLAWSAGRGAQEVLGPEERVEAGTVMLPGLSEGYPESPGRRADARRFMAAIHREYFAAMREQLRRMGVRVPLVAVTDTRDPADLLSVASELDVVGGNWYFAHPFFRGEQWRLPSYVSMTSPLTDESPDGFLRRACGLRVFGRPVVLREANVCWPNPHRAAGLLQAAAYAAQADLDAVILFTYDTREAQDRLDYFNIARDPARWGMAALAGRIFLERRVPTAAASVAVCFGQQDPYRAADDALVGAVYDLATAYRVGNLFPIQALPRRPDLALEVSEGAAAGASVFSMGSGAPLAALPPAKWRDLSQEGRLSAVRAALGPDGAANAVVRDPQTGVMGISGRGLAAVAGTLGQAATARAGPLAVTGGPAAGAVVWYSLDGKDAAGSTRWLLKAVGNARNTGQELVEHRSSPGGAVSVLQAAGTAPIVTCTGASERPLVVSLDGEEVLRVWATDAVVELGRDGDRWLLYCDTPWIRVQLPQVAGSVLVTAHGARGSESSPGRADLRYPDGALTLEIRRGAS